MKKVELILVNGLSGSNNNKFYNLVENGDGTFTAHYGRVGQNPRTKDYPMSKWDSTIRAKEKKGYKNLTEMATTTNKVVTDFVNLACKTTQGVLDFLLSRNKHQIGLNYKVQATDVNEAQLDEAQRLIDDLTTKFKSKKYGQAELNVILNELYNVIPRKMKNVRDYLIPGSLKYSSNVDWLQSTLTKEQDLLDNMKTQVSFTSTQSNTPQNVTILDQLGITMNLVTDSKVIKYVKDYMDKHGKTHGRNRPWSDILLNVWEVDNPRDSKAFEDYSKSLNYNDIVIGWHGSRNENWLSILKNGLKIRPSGAVHTGSMFGDGIYISDHLGKSMNYTSSSYKGYSYGAGNDGTAFLAILEVEKGKEFVCKRHTSDCYSYSYNKLQRMGGFDSCNAPGGIYHSRGGVLQNSELIVYKNEQVRIKYLIQVK